MFNEETMAEAYLKRWCGDHGMTVFSGLAFFGMKRHRDNRSREREGVHAMRQREEPVYVAK